MSISHHDTTDKGCTQLQQTDHGSDVGVGLWDPWIAEQWDAWPGEQLSAW